MHSGCADGPGFRMRRQPVTPRQNLVLTQHGEFGSSPPHAFGFHRYYKANDAASYDDWRKNRSHWMHMYHKVGFAAPAWSLLLHAAGSTCILWPCCVQHIL